MRARLWCALLFGLLTVGPFGETDAQQPALELDRNVQAFLDHHLGTWRDLNVTALANFKEAGLAAYIDARLGDAHQIVPALAGPFDFVFSDADKDWYKNYFVAVWPKLLPGGCFTAHNVSGWFLGSGAREFLAHVKTLQDAVTTIDTSSREGISITCKRER